MPSKSQLLLHYKRKDIQEEMVRNTANKEVVGSYGKGYAKRPDILVNPNDVLELVKQGISSFHASEEIWRNPLALGVGMSKKQMDEQRIGWDLVLDVDCKVWEYSKYTTQFLINEIVKHGISSVTCKFSGNKGFHIGIPFEAFPKMFNDTETRMLFPEGTRRIALYLMDRVKDRLAEFILQKDDIEAIMKKTGKSFDEVTFKKCSKCGAKTKKHVCICGNKEFTNELDILSIIDVDTILISARHLYRLEYSFNEKSGLVSVPVDIDRVLEFEKDMAKSDNLKISKVGFLNRENVKEEGTNLLVEAFDHNPEIGEEKVREAKTIEDVKVAILEDFFPPCMHNIYKGLKDGRKRCLFVVINFLTSVGWSYEMIKSWLEKWNKNNSEPMKEVLIKGQVRYHKQQKKKILPPNCDNKMYYVDLGVCTPDNLCQHIKNPVQYAKRKVFYLNKSEKDTKKKEKTKKASLPSVQHERKCSASEQIKKNSGD